MKKTLFFILAFYTIANSYCQTGEEYYKNGILKAESKDYPGAILDFTKAIETKSIEQNIDNIAECYYKRGLAKNQLQDYRGASLDIQTAYVSNANQTLSDALICLNIGVLMSKYGDFPNAIDFLNNAIEYNPNYTEAYFFRGMVKYNLQDNRGAISDYNKAIELDSNNADAYSNRGISKKNLKDYKGAIADFNKTIEINPNHATAYYGRGMVKLFLNQKDSGCLDFSKAGELGYKNAYEAIKELCK